MPLGVQIVGANIHDSRLVRSTLEENFVFWESQGVGATPDNLCLDKGYDYLRVQLEVQENGLVPHIRARGEEEVPEKSQPARRWVVERCIAWFKGFRGIRTRYCQKLRNFLGMVHFACSIILFRRLLNI
jgi:putative transposase